MAKHDTPTSRDQRAGKRSARRSLSRFGAAAVGAGLLLTSLTGYVAASYDQADGYNTWYVADKDDKKGGGNAQAKPEQPKNEQKADEPKPQAATVQQAAPPEQPKNNETKHEDKAPKNEDGGQAAGGQQAGGGQGGGDQGGAKHVPPVTEENTRGKSGSNPDGGGVDKPYDAAGQSANSQQNPANTSIYSDGNNGCGQDKKVEPREDDFGQKHQGWDDNNGWCGKPNVKHEQATATPTAPKPPATAIPTKTFTPVNTATPVETATPTSTPESTVLGATVTVTGTPATETPVTATPTNTATPVETAVAGATEVPSATSTDTAVEGATEVPTEAPTLTPTDTAVPDTEGTSTDQPGGPTLGDVQPGDLTESQADQIAEIIGGDVVGSDIQGMSGEEIAAFAAEAGVSIESIEAVLGESVRRDVPGEAFIENVLGEQARQGYENVVAGAMASTGGAPVGPLALGLAALGGVGVALRRRFTRRSI